MRLLPARRKPAPVEAQRSDPFLSLQEWADMFTQFAYQGSLYTQPASSQEEIAPSFAGLARAAYKSNGIVFACLTVRQLFLSEARFAFRRIRNGRPAGLWSNADLAMLETPWPGATTGNLITRMEMHGSLGGNWFGTSRYGGVRTLRPDWTTLLVGSRNDPETALGDPEAEVIGYIYKPGGPGSGRDLVTFGPEEVAHYAPIPDPEAQFRGMSWLTPIIREVMGDKAASDHKLAFFENAATPNLHVKMDVPDLAAYEGYVKKFREQHESVANAYRTLFTTSAVDLTPLGLDFQQMEFKITQGAGETWIAAAARTPPAIVGLSEGLQGSSLNAGNFEAAMRSFGDLFARPTWREMAGALAPLVNVPFDSVLWYDDRDIPALREDIRTAGERLQANATAISTLQSAGFTRESVVEAVISEDFSVLVPDPNAGPSVQTLPAGPSNGSPAANGASAPIPTP